MITICHRAWLACLSPPGLSRCRTVLPEEAGIGATAHRCAQAASDRSRPGWAPAAISSSAAVSGPTPYRASAAGPARLGGAGGADGIERVRLALPAAVLPVRAVDLHDPHPGPGDVPGQASAVAAGPFDPGQADGAEPVQPVQ